MKSRTNAQQELMRQQMIEEERNNQIQNSQNQKVTPLTLKITKNGPRNANPSNNNDKITGLNKVVSNDFKINKRERSSSYSVMSNHCQAKHESLSPAAKSPMDLAFSNLGNDDALDWNQLEPSIITTSDDLLDQIARGQHDTIHESFMETGTEENDSLQDDQSVSSIKPSTSCPTNMAHPIHLNFGHISQHNKTSQKPVSNVAAAAVIVEDQKLQWMRDRNKKDCHNRIERKRRDYINNQIQELGQLLPEKLFLSTESKRNKGGILKNSVIYIQQLQQVLSCLQHLQKEAQISENLISAFYKRVQYLESLLTENRTNFEEKTNEKITLQEWFNIHQSNSHLLQNVNSIQSSWSSDHGQTDKSSNNANSYDDVTVKSEDISAESILNSVPIRRIHSSNSGAGGSSSGTQSVTNYNSPINVGSVTNTTNVIHNSKTNSSSFNNNCRSLSSQSPTVNIVQLSSPQQRHSQIYGSSQPFTKTGTRLYEQSSKPSDSPVLSSILIGSTSNAGLNDELPMVGRHQILTGLSNSMPDESRTEYLTQNLNAENISGERYYLIPISKSKGLQLMTGNLKNNRGIIKVDGNLSNMADSPHTTVLNSYSIRHDDEVQNFIEISPSQNYNEDSLMGEFEFDDIPME